MRPREGEIVSGWVGQGPARRGRDVAECRWEGTSSVKGTRVQGVGRRAWGGLGTVLGDLRLRQRNVTRHGFGREAVSFLKGLKHQAAGCTVSSPRELAVVVT